MKKIMITMKNDSINVEVVFFCRHGTNNKEMTVAAKNIKSHVFMRLSQLVGFYPSQDAKTATVRNTTI